MELLSLTIMETYDKGMIHSYYEQLSGEQVLLCQSISNWTMARCQHIRGPRTTCWLTIAQGLLSGAMKSY